MAGTGARELLCVILLLTAAVLQQQQLRTCSARPLPGDQLQASPAVEGSGSGLLHAAAVHVDAGVAAAGLGGSGAAREGGDDAGVAAAVPYEDKRLSPGGPDPQHH